MAENNNNQVETKEIENKSNGKVVEVKAKKTMNLSTALKKGYIKEVNYNGQKYYYAVK